MKFRSLICLALIHMLVDTTAQLLTPLWPLLKETFSLSPWGFTALYAAWQASASVSQPLFACWGDRWSTHWIVWLGPGLAIVCIGVIGFAGHPLFLALLLIVGGFGVGALSHRGKHREQARRREHSSGTGTQEGRHGAFFLV